LFVDGQAIAELPGNWSITANARHGWTSFAAGSFGTSGYSLSLDRQGVLRPDDTLTLLISQPLRVESGGFSMLLPLSYDYQTLSTSYGPTRMSLAPEGREIAAEIGYTRPWRFGSAGFNVFARRQPGHFASAAPDVGGALQLKLKL
jgi:hypothetical protein